MPDRILLETKFLRCIERDGWYFVERPHVRGVVAVVAVTPEGRLLLVEQHRPAVGGKVIELPAGLAGDGPDNGAEDLAEAAHRELTEETGYHADGMRLAAELVSSPGLTSEVVSFFLADGLRKVGRGGGVDGEAIAVHEVPLAEVTAWLRARQADGRHVSAKVYTGLWLAGASTENVTTGKGR